MRNKRLNYRQGVVRTINHPSLENGQIVYVINEDEFYYTVQSENTSNLEKIEKKDISFD
jgi:hypothetical protein